MLCTPARLKLRIASLRSPAAPDAPTVAEAGFPDFTFGGLLGLFGPKSMAPELRERIASEVQGTLSANPKSNSA